MFQLRKCLILSSFVVYLQLLLCHEATAELGTLNDNSISNLYDNMLHREYPAPVVFPNQFQVERKAQRSPSLRLRFGRRSGPAMLPSAEKRWFGDVNQKPIRSPSLRLRFGRRSDPNMPIHNNFDILMNPELQNTQFDDEAATARLQQWAQNDDNTPDEYDSSNGVANERDFTEEDDRDLLNLLQTEKLRQLLLALRRADTAATANYAGDYENEFKREERKPAPLRLRWGRSTGGKNTLLAEEKKNDKQNSINAEQAPKHEQMKV